MAENVFYIPNIFYSIIFPMGYWEFFHKSLTGKGNVYKSWLPWNFDW